MTDPETDKEITAAARKLAATIDQYVVIWQQLEAIGKKIKNHLDNPESKDFDGFLGILASGANSAAIMSESGTGQIRVLSRTLCSLLDDKKETEND